MSEQNPNDIDVSRLSPGSRVRAVADDEIGPEHLGEIDDAHARLSFERALRDSVARSMTGPETAAPPELRDRIQTLLRAERGEQADVVRTPLGDTRERSFWSGAVRIVAVAAVLALCATAVIMSSRHAGAPSGNTLQAGLLTSFVHTQHDLCRTDHAYSDQKFTARDEESAVALAREHFGEVPKLIEHGFTRLERIGFRFTGMGRCAVPGEGRSAHVVFHDPDGNKAVSLFIQADRNEWVLSSSRHAILRKGLDGDQVIVVWRDERFFYFLIATRNEDLVGFRQELGVPSEEGELAPAR